MVSGPRATPRASSSSRRLRERPLTAANWKARQAAPPYCWRPLGGLLGCFPWLLLRAEFQWAVRSPRRSRTDADTARAISPAARNKGSWMAGAMIPPAKAVPADPAVIFKAPIHTNTWPRAAAGAYSLRAAKVAAKKYELRPPAKEYAATATGNTPANAAPHRATPTAAPSQVIKGSASVRKGRIITPADPTRPPSP